MFLNKIKSKLVILLIVILMSPINVVAYSEYIILGGQSVGIEIEIPGVMIVGMYSVGNESPGRNAGLKIGDMIVGIEKRKAENIEEMVSAVTHVVVDDSKKGYGIHIVNMLVKGKILFFLVIIFVLLYNILYKVEV